MIKTVIRNVQQLSFSPPLTISLSHAPWRVYEACINEGECLPIYTLLSHWPNIRPEPTCHLTWGPLTSPRETTNTYYMMLHWGLLPRLTTEVVPEGLDTIYTSRKGVTHIPNGGTTTYNDNIHQNIFRSYKYINIGIVCDQFSFLELG